MEEASVTPGAGPKVNKHRPAKRVKAAFRRHRKAHGEGSLKAFARAENDEDSKAWFQGKKQAHPPLKVKPKIARVRKSSEEKKKGKKGK